MTRLPPAPSAALYLFLSVSLSLSLPRAFALPLSRLLAALCSTTPCTPLCLVAGRPAASILSGAAPRRHCASAVFGSFPCTPTAPRWPPCLSLQPKGAPLYLFRLYPSHRSAHYCKPWLHSSLTPKTRLPRGLISLCIWEPELTTVARAQLKTNCLMGKSCAAPAWRALADHGRWHRLDASPYVHPLEKWTHPDQADAAGVAAAQGALLCLQHYAASATTGRRRLSREPPPLSAGERQHRRREHVCFMEFLWDVPSITSGGGPACLAGVATDLVRSQRRVSAHP